MCRFPDFLNYGYQIEAELGANRSGGRVTYLATDIRLNAKVVIKQFQFAQVSSSWSAYDAHQCEIDILRTLVHPGIPHYLNSFQVADGFCMVQEYKPAYPLSVNRSFSAGEVKAIAVQVLNILIYLQDRIPPIIHRDLKPENILIDESLNVFLVDFGFARIGDGEVGVSSVVKGTLGFMPPEQLFNRKLTESSDLYGLGMTLICLLTNTKTDDIGELVDISYKVRFKHLVPRLSIHWVKWLEKMTEPRVKDRFANAQEAFKALPTSSIRLPEIQLSHSEIYLRALKIGETLSHIIDVTNVAPEIQLAGTWKVQQHPNDPVTQNACHPWITVTPTTFENNQVQCCLTIDTGQLRANETYHRTLILETNALPQTYLIDVQVKTAPIPIQVARVSLHPLIILFAFVLCMARVVFGIALPQASWMIDNPEVTGLGLSIGAIIGLQGAAWLLQHVGTNIGLQLITVTTVCFSMPTIISLWLLLDELSGSWDAILSGLIPGMFGGWMLGLGAGLAVEKLLKEQTHKTLAIALVILTSFLGVGLALGWAIGFTTHHLISLMPTVFAISLLSLLLKDPLNHAKRVASYRRSENSRIRP